MKSTYKIYVHVMKLNVIVDHILLVNCVGIVSWQK